MTPDGAVAPGGAGTSGARAPVGLVVVSHSRPLARAAVELASQMTQGRPVPIAVAAGLDAETLGTDAVAIAAAIEEVAGSDGAVVLMDLGSAVLSAELALELLSDSRLADRVVLSAAPLVEGLVAAVVAAAGGAGRGEVAAEAGAALLGKAAQLGEPASAGHPPPETVEANAATGSAEAAGAAEATGSAEAAGADAVEETAEFTLANRHGLHARPAALLVGAIRDLDARVQLRNLTTGAGPLPAASLSRLATLGALHGHRIQVLASGPQARVAVERVLGLAGQRFGEPADEAAEPARPSGQGPQPASPGEGPQPASPGEGPLPASSGEGPLPASPGIGIGPVRLLRGVPAGQRRTRPGGPAQQWQQVTAALATVRREITRYRDLAGPHQAGIFDAHLLLLDDPELLADVRSRLAAGADAETACAEALAEVERQWAGLADPYLRARAEDVRAIGAQLAAALTGAGPATLGGPGILVAAELAPGQVAELDAGAVQGIVLAYGSASSHAAILARSRGIPAVVGAGPEVLAWTEGSLVALDGSTGELVADPPEATVSRLRGRAAELTARRSRDRAAASGPAATADGVAVEVNANLASHAEALAALASGADGAGLVRTEFLFADRDAAPDRDEQAACYLAIAEAMAGRRITLRTLDVGGDKPLAYLPMPAEENPQLGCRGIRFSLRRRELLLEQLAAICDAARKAPVNVLFPMVSTVAELREARRLLDEAAGSAGLPDELRVGMMVEVPAAALKIASFLPHLDFVSIGTNDLTQYTLAAERGNAAVAGLADPLDPGVLGLVGQLCRTVAGRVPVAVCGEAAADEAAIGVLIGLGVRELSVAVPAVPAVKARVRALEVGRCVAVAERAVTLDDAAAVRALVAEALPG